MLATTHNHRSPDYGNTNHNTYKTVDGAYSEGNGTESHERIQEIVNLSKRRQCTVPLPCNGSLPLAVNLLNQNKDKGETTHQ